MIVAFSVAPSGGDETGSVSAAVADAVRVVRDSGLPYELTSMFTSVEGDWDEVMEVVRGAVDAVSSYGSRVSLVLKADIRPGHSGELDGELERLEAALARRRSPGAGGDEVRASQGSAAGAEVRVSETLAEP